VKREKVWTFVPPSLMVQTISSGMTFPPLETLMISPGTAVLGDTSNIVPSAPEHEIFAGPLGRAPRSSQVVPVWPLALSAQTHVTYSNCMSTIGDPPPERVQDPDGGPRSVQSTPFSSTHVISTSTRQLAVGEAEGASVKLLLTWASRNLSQNALSSIVISFSVGFSFVDSTESTGPARRR